MGAGLEAHLEARLAGLYTLDLDAADYGLIEAGDATSCEATGICYRLGVDDPALRPATHWEAAFDEALSDGSVKTWSLHIGVSFDDVPPASPFYPAIETLLHHEVTGGCSGTEYCPGGGNTRDQMAVFLLRAAVGGDYAPTACVGQIIPAGDPPPSPHVFSDRFASDPPVPGC